MYEDHTGWSKENTIMACIMAVEIIAFGIFLYWGITTGWLKGDESSSQCQARDGYSICQIQQPDGKTTTCIKSPSGILGGGGISCDWEN